MEPFYFGDNQQLFGAYHMPEGTPRKRGLLIAGPLLHEGIRAHFALRQISQRCAAAGYDVLRFDYCGLGNSLGHSAEATFDEWSQNIKSAAAELASISGSMSLSILAVRFSANLVLELTQSSVVEQLLLWDPVLTGKDWHGDLVEDQQNLPVELQRLVSDEHLEFKGFQTEPNFLVKLDSRDQYLLQAKRLSAIVSNHYSNLSALEKLTEDIEQMDADCNWNTYGAGVLYPIQIIDAICQRLR